LTQIQDAREHGDDKQGKRHCNNLRSFRLWQPPKLKSGERSSRKGVPTFVIDEVPINQRDFTKGKAEKLLLELKRKGAVFVRSEGELLNLVGTLKMKGRLAEEVQ
jgi:hypothetical protein